MQAEALVCFIISLFNAQHVSKINKKAQYGKKKHSYENSRYRNRLFSIKFSILFSISRGNGGREETA